MNENKSIKIITLATTLLFAIATTACGASPTTPRTYRVGIINPSPGFDDVVRGFKDGMVKLGYVDGKNITYIYDGPSADIKAQTAEAISLENKKVDLIFSNGTDSTSSAQAGTKTTPIVFAPVAYPVAANISASLSKPGGHTTGVANGGSDGMRLQWLLKVAPQVKRVYIPIKPDETVSQLALKQVQAAADTLGVTLVLHNMSTADEVNQAIAQFPTDVDAMFSLPGPWLEDYLPQLVDLSIKKHLPFATESAPDDGGLVTYIADDYKVGFQAASLADQIFKGSSAGDLPIETAEFALGINLKTAKAIGIDVPTNILSQAINIIR
jgi:putative ABC transport system substrate-binding protein